MIQNFAEKFSCYLYIVMMVQHSKKQRIKDPVCSYLRKLISPFGFGWEKPGGVDRYTNEQLIRWYNANGFMGSPTNSHIYAHFAGQDTLYFWADGRKTSSQTISMIDIDCHQRGNPQSAKAFAAWLIQNGFPDLYHEPSTHGKGRHGYFVLFKDGFKDIAVVNVLKRLDKTLKKLLQIFLATHPEHQIENVEIKGTPHVITWVKGTKRQIDTMKSGALAKLPRDIFDRFDEFKQTTVLSFDDIDDLGAKVDRIVIPAPTKLSVFRAKGSTPNHPITKDEVEAIGGSYLEFARTWVTEPVGTSSRAKVDAMDLAIAFSILKFCSQKMNSDGTMPTARINGIWDQMFENGEVDRAFDYHRWRVIRNLIEVQSGLEMEDRHFYTGFINDQGHVIRGLAAKWKMAEWLVETLDEIFSYGFVDQASGLSPCHRQGGSLLQQQQQEDQAEILLVSPEYTQGGSLLEQEVEQDNDYGFDRDWIIEFRQSMAPEIGLIWGGSIQNMRRETG
jgi:hypothetical protein